VTAREQQLEGQITAAEKKRKQQNGSPSAAGHQHLQRLLKCNGRGSNLQQQQQQRDNAEKMLVSLYQAPQQGPL
jgi:hypothetical protein